MGTKGLGDNQMRLVGVVEVSGIEPLTSCMPCNSFFVVNALILQTYYQCAAHNFSVLAPLNTRIPASGLTFNAPRKRTHCNRALAAYASAQIAPRIPHIR